MDVGIIRWGAAGFFAAISVKENYPSARVTILEKSKKCWPRLKSLAAGGAMLPTAAIAFRSW